jgi:acyl-coenzyme A synthetase/AMP-(fatty) acid ligase
MNQPKNRLISLRSWLNTTGDLSDHFVEDSQSRIAMSDLMSGSALYNRGEELSGRSVLIATRDQLTTASVLIELDGLARRMVLCPPDLPLDLFPFLIDAAEIDAIVSDRAPLQLGKPRTTYFGSCSRSILPGNHNGSAIHETEWILLTSGTTGLPKLVAHTLASLAGAIKPGTTSSKPVIWSTFYDIRRYGGLQIFLRAVLTGTSLVLSSAEEGTADFLARAGSSGVTHISGTPSQWRRALMSSSVRLMAPQNVRLSGEAADQAILSNLRDIYPQAQIVHAFASTEAGVAFEVNDGMSGFASEFISGTPGVEMKVIDGTLRIRSDRTARRYLGDQAPQLRDADGFVDTADLVELRDGRYHFMGRFDGIINVAGLKVYPEEIEAVINRHPEVRMSMVRARKSPVTGSLVVADVVLKVDPVLENRDTKAIRGDILQLCRETLSAYKVPATINIVPALKVAESGKVMRQNA